MGRTGEVNYRPINLIIPLYRQLQGKFSRMVKFAQYRVMLVPPGWPTLFQGLPGYLNSVVKRRARVHATYSWR